jgi:hypothetical protein
MTAVKRLLRKTGRCSVQLQRAQPVVFVSTCLASWAFFFTEQCGSRWHL